MGVFRASSKVKVFPSAGVLGNPPGGFCVDDDPVLI